MENDIDLRDIAEFLLEFSSLTESLHNAIGIGDNYEEEHFDALIDTAAKIAESFTIIQNLLTCDGNEDILQVSKEEIPSCSREVVLDQMRTIIKAGILKQSDKYHRLREGFIPIICANDPKSIIQGKYRVDAYHWSDSAVFYDVYINGGETMPVVYFLNRCGELGAYTKAAWGCFAHDQTITPQYLIERYKIKEHVKPTFIASGTYEECIEAIKTVVEWNRAHIGTLEEMVEDKDLNFIRIHRKKGEIESTRCMNGECIGVIFASETTF